MTWNFPYYSKNQTEEKEYTMRIERERKYSEWDMPETPDSVSNWKLWSEVKTKGQDKKELSKTLIFKLTLALFINSIRA